MSWFLVTLLPVSNLIVVSGIIMAERTLYLPSVGACALGGHAAQLLMGWKRALVTLPVLVIALFAVLSAMRAPVWSDPLTLFEDTVENGRYRGHIALTGLCGEYLGIMGADPSREEELLDRALGFARESVKGNTNLSNLTFLAQLLERKGIRGEALENWEHMRRVEPASATYNTSVRRLVDEIISHPGRKEDLRRAIKVGRDSVIIAVQRGDGASASYWQEHLVILINVWIDDSVLRKVSRKQELRAKSSGQTGKPSSDSGNPTATDSCAVLLSAGPTS